MAYHKTTLDNGIRVITESLKSVHSISLGVCLTRGSRDESEAENGLSHFIEHMLFKGTQKRSAKDIAISIDSIGGEINAFTTKEFTYYYARFLDEHLDKVWDLIADILNNSKFDPEALELERGVILEEIKSFEDSPDDQALYRLAQALFEPHPISRSIMGPQKNVKSFTRDTILKFREKHYRGENLIISACGNLEHQRIIDLAASSFNFKKEASIRKETSFPKFSSKSRSLQKNDISQVHVTLGTRTIKYEDKSRYQWLILNTFLGGGISSRLFQRLREKEALVYQVVSFLELLTDIGAFGIYLATDPANKEKAINCIWDEFDKLKKHGLEHNELKRTKEHLKGALMLGLESTTNRMISLLKNEMHLKKYIPPDETLKEIEKVDEQSIQSLIK
ncbi:insulinase family protein, partial [candidate division WOR-3 bacterium]|nr:insulinase family protein [candidate division WOR-3 bacterium]